MPPEVHKSGCEMRHARKPELEPEQMQLMIGMAVSNAGPVPPMKLTGIKNKVEKAWTKPLEPDIEPETHNRKDLNDAHSRAPGLAGCTWENEANARPKAGFACFMQSRLWLVTALHFPSANSLDLRILGVVNNRIRLQKLAEEYYVK